MISSTGDVTSTGLRDRLRAATRDLHDRVDSGFAGFDLRDRAGYTAFLTAHARVLPAAEAVIDAPSLYPQAAARAGRLHADLAALGQDMPPPLPLALPDDAAARWGMLYVLEGSRLGGAMLVRQVPDSFPTAYLGTVHDKGGWRAFQEALDSVGAAHDDAWVQRACAGATALFEAFADAAEAR